MSNLDTKDTPVLQRLFGTSKPIIGMVHVLPLPGSPYYRNGSSTARSTWRGEAIHGLPSMWNASAKT